MTTIHNPFNIKNKYKHRKRKTDTDYKTDVAYLIYTSEHCAYVDCSNCTTKLKFYLEHSNHRFSSEYHLMNAFQTKSDPRLLIYEEYLDLKVNNTKYTIEDLLQMSFMKVSNLTETKVINKIKKIKEKFKFKTISLYDYYLITPYRHAVFDLESFNVNEELFLKSVKYKSPDIFFIYSNQRRNSKHQYFDFRNPDKDTNMIAQI